MRGNPHIAETLGFDRNGPNFPPEQLPLATLAEHLRTNIQTKLEVLESAGRNVEILSPDWCRENPALAGQMHADVIVATYGTTYALPNKDPVANKGAIEEGSLDIYLLREDDETVGTACLVNTGDGRAELGRSASLGNVGNSVIQDLRILDWIVNPEAAAKYHTLFTTLRSAPDRPIQEDDGTTFVMRGGQGVTAHWRKFPGLLVNGFGPLYLKHGELEQFSCASLTRNQLSPDTGIFVDDVNDADFVHRWHENYSLAAPRFAQTGERETLRFDTHYPPQESGLTHLVHADVVENESGNDLPSALDEADEAGSPFTQLVLPIDRDTREVQRYLRSVGYQVFSYQPAYENQPPALVYGKVKDGISVVPTFWSQGSEENPFWTNRDLSADAERISAAWKIS